MSAFLAFGSLPENGRTFPYVAQNFGCLLAHRYIQRVAFANGIKFGIGTIDEKNFDYHQLF